MKELHLENLELSHFLPFLSGRNKEANKSHFGHVLIIGGDYGYSGAVRLAGEAALRVGSGLVSIATRPEHALILNATRPELMCHGVEGSKELCPLLEKATVVIIGPGLNKTAWGQKLLYLTLKINKPLLVVDADGLNLLADKPCHKENWVLTPHPGEAARLLKTTIEAIQSDRQTAVLNLQNKFGGVCVLKGAGTLIATPDKKITICKAGNPGMATGGMGDVLSGVIGGLLAQQIPLNDAAKLGVLIHALAGDKAATQGGERGMLASDLLPYLRQLVNVELPIKTESLSI